MLYLQCFPQVKKKKERGGGGGGGLGLDITSMRSKQIKHSNDHIKGSQARKGSGGGGGGSTLVLGKHCSGG